MNFKATDFELRVLIGCLNRIRSTDIWITATSQDYETDSALLDKICRDYPDVYEEVHNEVLLRETLLRIK